MKKFISVTAFAMASLLVFSACGNVQAKENSEGSRLKIVTTIFPEYDWVCQILGDKKDDADVFMLLDNGVDLHSYQPTAEDIMNIADCDMFIYVGGESDEWVEDALKEKVNDNMKVINLLEVLGDKVKEEELVEGMEGEEEEDGEASDAESENAEDAEDSEEEEIEYDEHVWLSLKNTEIIASEIAAELEALDPDNSDVYIENAASYVKELEALDAEYEKVVSEADVKTVLFGDRFPFRYLTDDYDLDYYAAFVGCSAETEASFETIVFLADKVDALGLKSVLTIEGADHKIADTIVQNTKTKDQQILTMDSMQSTTSKDVAGGASYLQIMKDNLEVLSEALGAVN
ncbi:metal ABC transporter substrate-binding protein [Butyrivibrio sp. VCD2006]|uniref:metal ABC transporter substrate-binding protein n=1 Tax=Butyrivibrio sp. VCD2006 TaxID=1280664 RepID=UPI00042225F5|nr:metal ABC transporter substrate-binding protein [Butyrivibrio sp. VCD2006]